MSTLSSSDAGAGFTGLEAAIVLIAFVVVASIFSYTILGAGFYFSGESRSVVCQGIRQAGSGITVAGHIYGISASQKYIDSIIIPICLTPGSEPIDITTVSVRIFGSNTREEIRQNSPLIDAFPGNSRWSVQERFNSNPGTILEPGELFILNITPMFRANFVPYSSFSIEIKPAGSMPLRVARTVPGYIDRVTRLGN
ncbi:MAG: flagellin [Methanomicrobiales archaeon]|nr:flagellin [Methanomicrobiales archaeon]